MAHGLRVLLVMVEKAGQQDHHVTAHIMSTARKQRKTDSGDQLAVSLFFFLN